MTLSVELNFAQTLEISKQLIFSVDLILDDYFGQKKTLYEIGWCLSYMIDKRKKVTWLNFPGWIFHYAIVLIVNRYCNLRCEKKRWVNKNKQFSVIIL